MEATVLNRFSGHSGAIYDMQFDGNGYVYTASADKFVVRWDVHSGQQDGFAVKLEASAFRLCLLGDSQKQNHLVIGSSKGNMHIVDLDNRQEVKNLAQHQTAIFALSTNKFNNHFYSADSEGWFCVWDAVTFDLLLTFPFNCGKIRCIAVAEEGSHVAICGQDGIVRILETSFYNEIISFKAHAQGVNSAAFIGDELITGGKDAHLSRWNWKKGILIQTIPAHNYAVYDILPLLEMGLLATASFDKTIKIWSLKDFTILLRIERKNGGHKHVVNRLVKINHQVFCSTGDDREVIKWELRGA